MEQTEKKDLVKLRRIDLIKHWLGGYSQETCYNYERLQALGSTQAIIPVIKRLYKTKEERAKALKKYMVFFNTEPSFIGTIIPGISASMEEQAANGVDVTEVMQIAVSKVDKNGVFVAQPAPWMITCEVKEK